MDSLLSIISSQRERFRARNHELEAVRIPGGQQGLGLAAQALPVLGPCSRGSLQLGHHLEKAILVKHKAVDMKTDI